MTGRDSRQETLIERLREARIQAGLTQQQAANALGKPQSFVSKLETGERRVEYLELEELARIYKVDIGFFGTLRDRRRRQ